MYYIFQAVVSVPTKAYWHNLHWHRQFKPVYKTLSTSSWLFCEMPQSNNNFKDFKIMFLVRIILNHC